MTKVCDSRQACEHPMTVHVARSITDVTVKYTIWQDIIPDFYKPKNQDDFSELSINIFVIQMYT